MKLSGAVRNYWANELPAAAGAANRPVVRTAPESFIFSTSYLLYNRYLL